MKTYKAILYDIDGTLLNTLDMNMVPLQKIIKEELNEEWPMKRVLMYASYPGRKVMEELGVQDVKGVYARWVRYVNAYEGGARMYEGIEDVLQFMQDKGIIQAVVSAKTKAQYQLDVVNKGLHRFMKTAVLAEDTQKHKPDPQPLFECLKRLHMDASDVIYIGDASSDAIAAKQAGIDFGYATWGSITREGFVDVVMTLTHPSDIKKIQVEKQKNE